MTTDKTIEEMNAAIADFMELPKEVQMWRAPLPTTVWLFNHYWTPAKKLKYHEDWRALMPVGKKIRDYLQEQWKNRPPHTATNGDLLEVDISCAITCYDKAKAHKAVYDFIIWYNTTKQKD